MSALSNYLADRNRAFEEALPLYRHVGSVHGQATCIEGLGDIALQRSDHDAARRAFEEALPLYRQAGSVLGEANCIKRLENIVSRQNDSACLRDDVKGA